MESFFCPCELSTLSLVSGGVSFILRALFDLSLLVGNRVQSRPRTAQVLRNSFFFLLLPPLPPLPTHIKDTPLPPQSRDGRASEQGLRRVGAWVRAKAKGKGEGQAKQAQPSSRERSSQQARKLAKAGLAGRGSQGETETTRQLGNSSFGCRGERREKKGEHI